MDEEQTNERWPRYTKTTLHIVHANTKNEKEKIGNTRY